MPKVPPHIVVIDDDDLVRESLERLITLLGYSVDAFACAKAFLESNVVETASCVIADVQMPEMTGIELQRHLSAAGHKTPIIFVTGNPDPTARSRVIRDGAIGYLSKPFRQECLVDCLNRALG